MQKRILFSLIVILAFGVNLSLAKTVSEKKVIMKVKFYTLDIEKRSRDKFVGVAEIREGNVLIVNIADKNLREILTQPYKSMEGGLEQGKFVDKEVVYYPGTLKHLKAIAIGCYKFGYLGEIEEYYKNVSSEKEVE
ncbi:MAG: hypothetical protein J7K17_02280 [Candidatus Omnitrophica bacterium]|nr:hypothetical protein [Candidatus Omnitrophota bacterium]